MKFDLGIDFEKIIALESFVNNFKGNERKNRGRYLKLSSLKISTKKHYA
jgi:hypothetical protein